METTKNITNKTIKAVARRSLISLLGLTLLTGTSGCNQNGVESTIVRTELTDSVEDLDGDGWPDAIAEVNYLISTNLPPKVNCGISTNPVITTNQYLKYFLKKGSSPAQCTDIPVEFMSTNEFYLKCTPILMRNYEQVLSERNKLKNKVN